MEAPARVAPQTFQPTNQPINQPTNLCQDTLDKSQLSKRWTSTVVSFDSSHFDFGKNPREPSGTNQDPFWLCVLVSHGRSLESCVVELRIRGS